MVRASWRDIPGHRIDCTPPRVCSQARVREPLVLDAASFYAQTVRHAAMDQYGNWPPYRELSVGDYGSIRDDQFTVIG